MKGLLIKDEVFWHDRWSSQLGERLATKDSSNNLIIFDANCEKDEILSAIDGAPEKLYQILDLEEAPEEECDFLADSGTCYRKTH